MEKNQEQAPTGHHSRCLKTLHQSSQQELAEYFPLRCFMMLPEIPTAGTTHILASLEGLLLIVNMHWVTSRVSLPTINTTKQIHSSACGQ